MLPKNKRNVQILGLAFLAFCHIRSGGCLTTIVSSFLSVSPPFRSVNILHRVTAVLIGYRLGLVLGHGFFGATPSQSADTMSLYI